MKTSEIVVTSATAAERILPMLLGRVFHVTCRARFSAILKCGSILPNRNGELNAGFTMTPRTACRDRDAVSVFDFRSVSTDQLSIGLEACCPWQIAYQCGDEIAIAFLGDHAVSQLLTPENLKSAGRAGEMLVPFVEACHPGELQTEAICEVAYVSFDRSDEHPSVALLREANDVLRAVE